MGGVKREEGKSGFKKERGLNEDRREVRRGESKERGEGIQVGERGVERVIKEMGWL